MRLPALAHDPASQQNDEALAKRSLSGDVGNIAAKTSAQIDALFASPPADGAVATGLDGVTPILLMRRGGQWHKSAAYTAIP